MNGLNVLKNSIKTVILMVALALYPPPQILKSNPQLLETEVKYLTKLIDEYWNGMAVKIFSLTDSRLSIHNRPNNLLNWVFIHPANINSSAPITRSLTLRIPFPVRKHE